MTKKQKKELKKIIIALVLFFLLMLLEHSGILPEVFGNRWIMLVLYLVPYCIVGLPVVKGAVSGIRRGQMFDESFLMVLATLGAFATGENGEAVAVMLFYQVGEFFQSYAVGKSRRSISELMDIAPEYANVERADGSVETVDPDEVQIGDVLIIKPGERVPVDGVVKEGSSMLNTSALTGESVPRSAKPGDRIISGCINGEGLLKIEALKQYEDSTVAKILEMVENAASKKSRTENFITRFARYYTPIVVIGAVLLALIPPLYDALFASLFGSFRFGGGWSEWVMRACTFLVISCPCALVISVPLSFFGGIGAASNKGVLVKGSNYLELLSELDTVVSDKTGTLTKGEFKVNELLCAEGVTEQALLRTAALAEGMSTHPIALSIQEAYGAEVNTKLVSATENVSGQGIRAEIEGHRVLVGNAKLLQENGVAFEKVERIGTIVYVAQDGRFMGTILISDAVKPEAKQAIADMKAEGVRQVVMLTGDREEVGQAVGRELGLDQVYAELLPEDKVHQVETLLKGLGGKRRLAFIGDGINDAPVLSRADVGIAMGSMGSDAAIEAADVVIMDDNLEHIPVVIRIARKTVGIAKQNIVFALGVKIAVLLLGALGIANMWAAVFADVGVAFIAILNAMRAMRTK